MKKPNKKLILSASLNDYPVGIDISMYQYSADGRKKPDFTKIKQTTEFVAVRYGISWGYVDPWFAYSWENLSGHRRIAYHVLYFNEPAQKQMDSLFRANFNEHDRIALDCEVAGGNSKSTITNITLQCMNIIKQRTGRYPIIYSRASWVNPYLDVTALPSETDWWLANYLSPRPYPLYTPEMTPPPLLPRGVTKWLIHQTAEKANGSYYGVASHYVDTDRWNTSNKTLDSYFGIIPENPPVTPPSEQDYLFKAKCVCYALNKRSGPGTNYPALGQYLVNGDTVKVYEVKNNWYRIEKDVQVWVSGYPSYMRKL